MAGLATCLWQGFPEYNNMTIIDALRRSATLFQTPNERIGYGIPDMKKAVALLLRPFTQVAVTNCTTVNWTSKDVSAMRYEIERRKGSDTAFVKIAEQSGMGAVFQTHTYQFTDAGLRLQDGPVQYRIRQVIDTSANGFAAFYTDTVTVDQASCTPIPGNEKNIQVIPNPVYNSFMVKMDLPAISNLQLVVVNAIGQTVYTQRTSKPNGLMVIPVGMAHVAPGLYYLMVFDGGKRLATKPFVKL